MNDRLGDLIIGTLLWGTVCERKVARMSSVEDRMTDDREAARCEQLRIRLGISKALGMMNDE